MADIKIPKLRKINRLDISKNKSKKVEKKRIILMSDDLRMHSGIATQSKEFVFGTIDKYDWVQIGGAINHPEEGKILETGAHKELIQKEGRYRELCEKQFIESI